MPFRRFELLRRLPRAILRSLARGARLRVPARLRAASSFLISLAAHATLLVVLGMLVVWHEMQGSHGVTLLPFVEDIEPVRFVEELNLKVTALPADLFSAVAGDPAETRLPDAPNIPAPAPRLLAGPGVPELAAGPQRFTSYGRRQRWMPRAEANRGTHQDGSRPAGRATRRHAGQ